MNSADFQLNTIERRVLGVLIEKALSQPEYYPMTLNAVLAGCNQKSNREPEMAIDDSSVWRTLDDLRNRGLVSRILPAPGARSDRFKHEILGKWGWGNRQQAVMAELLLRGPQTVAELRARASRMTPIESPEAVVTVLESLAALDPPLVAQVSRATGERTVRYTHLLYPPDEAPPTSQATSDSAGAPLAAAGPRPGPRAAAEAEGVVTEALRGEIERIDGELAEFHEAFAELRRRLAVLESRLNH
ncbi:MAG: hypothetical protein CHACPFDD_00283 [Phycisphaerae bacterium]|nr:hypothetical protein [Phycisphaerae bacterium]